MLPRTPLPLPNPDVSASIEAALLAHAPALQAALTRQYRDLWDDQVLRKTALGGVPACPSEQDDAYLLIRDFLAPCCDSSDGLGPCGRPTRFLVLNELRLEQRMQAAARAAAKQWAQKILAKIGPITLPRLRFLDETELTLEALREKRRIRLDHRRETKLSPKGRIVTRYLGRIYLDGIFVPDARYRQEFH